MMRGMVNASPSRAAADAVRAAAAESIVDDIDEDATPVVRCLVTLGGTLKELQARVREEAGADAPLSLAALHRQAIDGPSMARQLLVNGVKHGFPVASPWTDFPMPSLQVPAVRARGAGIGGGERREAGLTAIPATGIQLRRRCSASCTNATRGVRARDGAAWGGGRSVAHGTLIVL
eukprot:gene56619-biopygen68184